MNVLDLFSGIGGFSLGLERAGMKTIAFCEIEPFCQKVLREHWPDVPIFEDIKDLNAEEITEPIDLICGGYPCQPFSLAGHRRGAEDDRHLWPEYLRLIQELRPRWVVAENVAGHINMGLDQVLSDLEGENYDWWAFIIPACGLNGWHKRERVWVVAHSESVGRFRERTIQEQQGIPKETVNITYHPSFRLLAAKLIDRKIGCAESLEQVNTTIISAVDCFAELAEAITA